MCICRSRPEVPRRGGVPDLEDDFNGWAQDADELVREPGDIFGGEVEGAAPGDEYLYVIHRGNDVLTRLDPRSLQATQSVGHSVIVDRDAFTWTQDDFRLPAPDEQVIYEMHVGTFNDAPEGSQGPGRAQWSASTISRRWA